LSSFFFPSSQPSQASTTLGPGAAMAAPPAHKKTFSCEYCGNVYVKKDSLLKHLKRCDAAPDYFRETCKILLLFGFISQIETHLLVTRSLFLFDSFRKSGEILGFELLRQRNAQFSFALGALPPTKGRKSPRISPWTIANTSHSDNRFPFILYVP
jgi:hypothetical protein